MKIDVKLSDAGAEYQLITELKQRVEGRLKEMIAQSYRNGTTQKYLASITGVSQPTIGRWLSSMGVEMRPTGRKPK